MRLLQLLQRSGGDGLLNEEGDAGEVLQELNLDVPALLQRSPEHRGAADNDSPGLFVGGVGLDELLEGLADTGVLVGRDNEGIAFFGQSLFRALRVGVDKAYNLEAGSEFTAMGIRYVRVIGANRGSLRTARA